MTESDKEKELRERRETPIIDGDARPDQNIEPDAQPAPNIARTAGDKKTLTKNRAADVDSLEDYKDTK